MDLKHDDMTIASALAMGKTYLQNAGFAGGEALLEARILLSLATGRATAILLAYDEVEIEPSEWQNYLEALQKRKGGMPMAFIRGSQEFYGLDFACQGGLIPRPDSEALVALALENLPQGERLEVLDLGCGSGCLGISVAVNCGRDFHLTLSDADNAALQNAKANGERYGAGKHSIIKSNWFDNIGGRFDMILCNPPYISEDDLPYLPKSVRGYEPMRALWGGVSGVQTYEILAEQAGEFLNSGGRLVLEIGAGQGGAVGNIFQTCGWDILADGYDLSGVRRALAFQRSEA